MLLLQIAAKSFQTCPEFSSQWTSPTALRIFENWSFLFLAIFLENFKFSINPLWENQKISFIWNTTDLGVKRSENWG